MNLKRKIYISISIIGIVVFSNYFAFGSNKGAKISTIEQPYIFYGERRFMVGFLETIKTIKEGEWGRPVPKIKEEKICNFVIKDSLSDTSGMYATILAEEKNLSLENSVGKPIFFTGYIKAYWVDRLIKENPNIEWLRNISLSHISVFGIEQILPIENNDNVLSVHVPDKLSNEFEILVTIRNTLQRQLIDSRLQVNISGGPFKIIEGDSYDTKTIEDKYESWESKVYTFRIQARNSQPFDKTDFKISVAFAGYGIEGNLVKPKIFPLYSKKSYKYQLQWMQTQKD